MPALLRLKPRQSIEPVPIEDRYLAILQRHQLAFTQLTQHAVHMNGTQPEGIGKNVLVERAVERAISRETDQLKSLGELKEEVSRPLDGAAPPDADEMLDDHGLVARGGP